jgi:hypothetical protein
VPRFLFPRNESETPVALREYDDGPPIVYPDGTVWFHRSDPHHESVIPARAVCVTGEHDHHDDDRPFAWPSMVSNDPTHIPTHRLSGQPLRFLRWATPHDIHPDL